MRKTAMELRKFERCDISSLMDYVTLDKGGKEQIWAMARTRNISIDGVCIETREPLRGRTRMRITLGLNDHLINVEGSTVYCQAEKEHRYVSGLSFEKVPRADRKALRFYLEQFTENENQEAQHL